MLIQGSAKSDRTNLLIEYYTELLDSGAEASKILVLTLNSFKKNLFINSVKRNLKTVHFENPQIHTFYGLAYNTLINNWSVVENSIQTGTPVSMPNLTGLEVSQFFFKQALKEAGFKDYNSKINLIHQLFRRYSLIVNNNLTDDEVSRRSQLLGEVFADDAKKAIDIYKKKTIEYRAFDYIRQLSVFNYLYKNTDCFKDIDYLIIDDADEITTAEFDFLIYLKPQLKEVYVGYDRHGSSRLGFLNTDIKTVERIEKLFCDEKKIDLDNFEEYEFETRYSSFSRRLEMAENALEKAVQLIESGVSPDEITIVTPLIDSSLRFSISEKFDTKNIHYQYFSGSEKLSQIPVVKDTLTLLNLSLGEYRDVYKVRSVLSNLLKIPVKYCMNAVSKYKQTGSLCPVEFGVKEYEEGFNKLLNVLEKIKDETLTLSERAYIIYKELINLSQDEIWQNEPFNFFMKQLNDFESVFHRHKLDYLFQKSVLTQLENSIISENPSSAPEIKANHVVIATAQKVIDFSIQTKYQFWLDVSSDMWVKDDFGTLYNAWAFQSSWNRDKFTYKDNLELSNLKTKKQLRKLSLLTENIFAFSSLFDIEGNENFGGIESYINKDNPSNNQEVEYKIIPRDDQKPVLDYKSGKMAISAVPGAGKTTILLALIIKLIQSGVKSDNIFVLTYMESAARNFKERIKSACPSLEKLPNISTIHGLSLRILKENSNFVKAGLDSDFEVCDDNTRQKIIREIMAQSGIEQDDFDKYEKAVSALKLSDLKQIPYVNDSELKKFLKFYYTYNYYLKKRNTIDYDDMLAFCVKILEENPDIAAYYQNLCHFVIEDEAQDSSVIQQKLLNLLSAKHNNLIRCGDINQAITTTFTNADIDGFREFLKEGLNISMNRSQRCSKEIYSLANRLVEKTKQNQDLQNALYDIKMEGVAGKNPDVEESVVIQTFDDFNEERNFILEKIREIFSYDKNAMAAILVRNNYHIDEYSAFLSNFGYNVITKSDCLNVQPVFMLIFAVLKLCAFPWQNENVLKVMEVLTKQKLLEFSKDDTDFVENLNTPFILQNEELLDKSKLCQLLWDINYWLENAGLAVDELAVKIGNYYYSGEIEKSNVYMIALLLKKLSVEYPEITTLMERLEDLAKRPVLNKFKFFTNEDVENRANRGIIQIMTYHKSKGDEFDYVFIPQLSEEVMPAAFENIKIKSKERFLEAVKAINSKYKKKDEKELKIFQAEENLRLFYVAVTRAKKKLYISCAKKYKKFSKIKNTEPSILFEKVLNMSLQGVKNSKNADK